MLPPSPESAHVWPGAQGAKMGIIWREEGGREGGVFFFFWGRETAIRAPLALASGEEGRSPRGVGREGRLGIPSSWLV